MRVRVGSFGEAATVTRAGASASSGDVGGALGTDAGRRWRSDMKLREMPSTVRRRDRDLGCAGASSVVRFEFDDTASPEC